MAREREHAGAIVCVDPTTLQSVDCAISRHLFLRMEDAKTSEGLLDIRLTFFSSLAYFLRAGAPSGDLRPTPRNSRVRYFFADYALDTDRRELRRGADVVATTPQVFDLLDYLIRNREHVVSKDDLMSAIWKGRIVSDAALTTRLNAARSVIGDCGDEQRLIKTLPRKGFRFVGAVHETNRPPGAATVPDSGAESSQPLLALPDKPSIAVLPLHNMSGDPEQQYFSDGITEDIITELSRFHSLFVIARNSSFSFRGKSVKVQEIARELGVTYLVEGSVRRAADRVRITAQLVDGSTGTHLWAERYDRDMRDIFALQDEVARSVASTVIGRVEAAGRELLRLSSAGLRAYDLILRAKALGQKFTRTDNAQALACAERALELDPTSARACAHAAWCHFINYMACWTAERERAFAKAYELAQRSVELDDTDSSAHRELGLIHLFRREYDEARSETERAIELNPNDADAHRKYGLFLATTGKAEAAIEQISLAKRLNPFDTQWVPWIMGIFCFTARRYDDAIAALRQARNPINEVRGWLAASYAHAGRLDEARATLDEFLRVAEADMAVFPGRRLKDWEAYWHGAFEYRDQEDFDHLFDALRKAGLQE
jgi:adenylate cyclase